ncbi:MAG: LamG-like jellyroll fold domain-containing protein [Candidatus Taylorbacteria bacterium]
MNHSYKSSSLQKGFTLLEILLVVAIISILAGIVIVAINPAKQLGSSRDAQRKSDISTIYKAVNQYLIDNGHYPTTITSTLTAICDPAKSCTGIDLSTLIPTYLASMPKDALATTDTGYEITKVGTNVYVEAPDTEVGFLNQPGYSSTTAVVAFVGALPTDHIPSAASSGFVSSGGTPPPSETSYALSFDGSNYVNIGATSAFGLSAPWTVEVWAKDYFSMGIINGESGWYFTNVSGGAITLQYFGDGGVPYTQLNPFTASGAWQHYAVVADGTYLTLFVDGTQVAQISSAGIMDAVSEVFYIGTAGGWNTSGAGTIDEVRISNSARYTTTFTPSTSFTNDGNTIALWKFNENTGTSAADSSSNSHTGTLTGTPEPTWVAGN